MEISLFMDLGLYDVYVLLWLPSVGLFIEQIPYNAEAFILFNWVIITGEFIQWEIRLIFDG